MATYNKENDRRWNEKNREHRNYLTRRSTTRGFIRSHATLDHLQELKELIKQREFEMSMSK